jgi:hypothetical protein
MKNQLLDNLSASLKNCETLAAENSDIRRLITQASDELATLETTCDFGDQKQLNRLAQLQAIKTSAPVRIDSGNERLEDAREKLVEQIEFFIRDAFAPRFQDLLSRIQEKVRAACDSKFHDADSAAETSPVVLELRQMQHLTMRPGADAESAQRKAKELIAAWETAQKFEAANLK